MTTTLHVMLYAALGLLGWLALVLSIGTLINGRSWVWARTREAGVELVWQLRHPRRLPSAVRLERDEPVAFMPRGWPPSQPRRRYPSAWF
jgi:hypothetical protein